MWFKQLQLFQLKEKIPYDAQALENMLCDLTFNPCMPSHPSSHGWASPLDMEDAPLVHAANGFLLVCMQCQDKILPATVVRQELDEKIKQIVAAEDRRVGRKEKLDLKDEVTYSLLTRAFSKMSRVYAFIDTRNQWLALNTTQSSKTEKFIDLWGKTVGALSPYPIDAKKLTFLLTQWLAQDSCPKPFYIERSCVLKDPEQESRVIHCQQQDLCADAIQSLLKDGCEVHQILLNWMQRVTFKITNEFSLRSIRYDDELISQAKDAYTETPEQQFDADFYIMSESLSDMVMSLLEILAPAKATQKSSAAQALEVA